MTGSPAVLNTKAIGAAAGPIIALLVGAVATACASGLEGPAEEPIPTTPAALHTWLLADGHGDWPRESGVHAPDQGGGVRVYLNPLLVASLEAGNETHPVGAAAVRELYESDLETQRGFGVLVKTEEQGPDGAAWFFYEIFSTTPGAPYSIAKNGAPGCVTCHQQGVDFVQSELPLP
jgi:hypothetical protein